MSQGDQHDMATRQFTPGHDAVLTAVTREMPADLETPVSAFLKLSRHGARFLLESVEQGETLGRYSFIGLDYLKWFRITEREIAITDRQGRGITATTPADPLQPIRAALAQYAVEPHPAIPRLLGGAVGYVGYDYVRHLERLPAGGNDALHLPLAQFYLVNTLLMFDHLKRRIVVVSLAGPQAQPLAAAQARVDEIIQVLRTQPLDPAMVAYRPTGKAEFVSNVSKDDFCAAVRQAQEHIRAGDIFQAVLSQRLTGALTVPPFQIYRALRILNPSPYMFYFDFGETQLIGSSPEALVRLDGRTAISRPIAGTRPRGASREADQLLATELLADEKERAEHVMLVDLARNDLGRVCDYGSVQASELFQIERYSHVMHIVSEVTGRLRDDQDAFSLLRATFPAGTVSGAPKVRAMEIIHALEPSRRGPYAGAVGYFGLAGDMDLCITIRTAVVHGGKVHLQGGAGVVADSVPEREYDETLSKMEALKRAVALAEEGL